MGSAAAWGSNAFTCQEPKFKTAGDYHFESWAEEGEDWPELEQRCGGFNEVDRHRLTPAADMETTTRSRRKYRRSRLPFLASPQQGCQELVC
jgi:hypothetical protein